MTTEDIREAPSRTGMNRRTVLGSSLAVAALGGPFAGLTRATAKPSRKLKGLFPVKDKRDGVVRLHLPHGFQYRSFHHTASPVVLDDGTVLPPNHDGMGAFELRRDDDDRDEDDRDEDRGERDEDEDDERDEDDDEGRSHVVLVRNHELNNPPAGSSPSAYTVFGPTGDHTYDTAARGGTTTIHVDRHGRVAHAYTSLNGTMMNCSGGQMPWGAWVTCEETVNGPDVGPDFTGASNEPLTQRHGYVFEVPTDDRSTARPVRSAGRFSHEAVSFDPVGGHLYLTEDNFGFPSGFYRYTPPAHPMEVGELRDGGRLEMLKVLDRPNAALHEAQPADASYVVEWVTIDDPDFTGTYDYGTGEGTSNNEAISYVGDQGRAKGAALFSRLEGQIYEDGVVYFCSTQGGPVVTADPPSGFGDGNGQVWAYDTRSRRLSIVYESPGRGTLDLPDNVTTSAQGTLVLCEDNDQDNYLRGLSRQGDIWDLALNRLPGMFDSEFAGSTFSPDGRTLFVNIQDDPALSFAIWGPWRSIGV